MRTKTPIIVIALALPVIASARPTDPSPAERERLRRETERAARLLREASSPRRPETGALARSTLDGMPDEAVVPARVKSFPGAPTPQRKLAAELLGARKGGESARALARAVVLDDAAVVRVQAVASLGSLRHPETASLFTQALGRREAIERMRAAEALRWFPSIFAVAGLVDPSTIRPGGVSRVHAAFLDERAYISGWELSAGGTGLTVAEVATPIISTQRTGVVLDVAMKYTLEVEWRVRVKTLGFLSGEKFRTPDEWQRWWAGAEKSFALAPDARALAEKTGQH